MNLNFLCFNEIVNSLMPRLNEILQDNLVRGWKLVCNNLKKIRTLQGQQNSNPRLEHEREF